MIKKLGSWWAAISFILFLLSCFLAFFFYALHIPVIKKKAVVFYLKPNASINTVIAELAAQKLIPYPRFFSLFVVMEQQFKPSTLLKTGEYLFQQQSTPLSIWQQMTQGRGYFYRQFTIIPGWSYNQLRASLRKTPTLNQSPFTNDDQKMQGLLGLSQHSLEGEFFAETYNYARGVADVVILKRAHDLMQVRFADAWAHRAADLPYKDAYEALIAASLIEKEAYLNSERALIASVLINRLRQGMLLQFDPTVIYGMAERYVGKIHKENLREDTPYNTYVHKGLPPTPIAIPSMASIDAALHPAQTEYLYFVAKGDGSHQFSKTLSEHNIAVHALIK